MQFDGTPVSDQSNQIIVRKSNQYNYDNVTETRHTMDSNGMVHYTTTVDDKNGFSLKVCAKWFLKRKCTQGNPINLLTFIK